jgi:secreted PhoX family phosphatase
MADDRLGVTRRVLLRGGLALAAGGMAPGWVAALLAPSARAGRLRESPVGSPYGEPVPTPDATTGLPLLRLPPGFTCRSFGWTGDPLSDGSPTPAAHDGMAVVQVLPNRSRDLVLVRNHELILGRRIGAPGSTPVYDPGRIGPSSLAGGTTTLVFRRGQWLSAAPSLAGTVANCAGGPTPWGRWLSCEETISDGRSLGALVHGFVFEVPAPALGPASARPIPDMGLFRHEAVAVDPRSGFVYETEDNGDTSGFYRYRPHDPSARLGALEAGGVLEMLAVADADGADLDAPLAGQSFEVSWVPIDEPAAFPPGGEGVFLFVGAPSGPYLQGRERGGARFRRLEGCWYAGGAVYFVDTSGGAAGHGVVWCYEPPADEETGRGRLVALFVSSGEAAAHEPDNVTVSPRGGLLLCEGAATPEGSRLLGLAPDGASYVFAVNDLALDDGVPGKPAITPRDYRSSEWAGACFDPTGTWLFVNVQRPGVTFAIAGPWGRGNL